MKVMKLAEASFINFREITTRVRFYFSYYSLKSDFISFKMYSFSKRKRMVDTDVVNYVTCTYQSVISHVVVRFL